MLDLTYHSVLLFQFEGRDTKGWVNSLILGDSSQGKSEVCLRMMEHYGLGERVECKSASVAGLLGGLQQIGNRWFVSWGVIPNHDRRLVILEEVKGAPVDVISKLTDMRSSGIAEIPKIERRRALARTRLVFVSNPRSDRPLSAYNFGVEAIKELIGGLEDVRRFDIAYLASATQIPAEEINRLRSAKTAVPHTVTSALCRRLILWTWTRRPEDVCFREDTLESLMKGAAYLCGKFTEAMPLVDRGTMRLKLARLSAALAARLFSTPDLRCLEVKPCHVQYVTGLVDRLYSDKIFGYADYTEAQVHANSVRDPGEVVKRIRSTKHPADLVESLLYASEITVNDIMDWTGLDRDDAQVELSFLVRKHALYRTKYVYVKTTEFIEVLKKMRADGLPASTDVKGAKF